MDEALTPVSAAELDDLEMFNVTASARAAADKAKKKLAPASPTAGTQEHNYCACPPLWPKFSLPLA